MNYYIADLHLGHENVLKFDNRPFDSVKEHDETIIKNWNEAVGYEDEVYILGDFSWYNVTKTMGIIENLNGYKHLIIGNHDKRLLKNKDFRALFIEICNYKEITLDNSHGIVLAHYPIPCFNNHYHGWNHMYGHVHNSYEWKLMENVRDEITNLHDTPCNMFNVGCMMPYMDYTPKTLTEIVDGYNNYVNEIRGGKYARK